MSKSFQVVDLFAGPGGLAEGFSAFSDQDGHRPFNVTLSVEKERAAHETLRLRAFLRQFEDLPDEYYDALNANKPMPNWAETHNGEWETAEEEALRLTLGEPEAAVEIDARIDRLLKLGIDTVLIGGPPCQAYSLVGRARNAGIADYKPEEDHRHFLYKEYIRILGRLKPVAFVMENVKGMLSSSVAGKRIFGQVIEDLRLAGGEPDSYELFALGSDGDQRPVLRRTPKHDDFLIKSENFGVPQTRHRVIIVGLRKDQAGKVPDGDQIVGEGRDVPASVRNVLSGLPRIRSRLTRQDGLAEWREVVLRQMCTLVDVLESTPDLHDVRDCVRNVEEEFRAANELLPISSSSVARLPEGCPEQLAAWIEDPLLDVILNHEARSHMPGDFSRYLFCAAFAAARSRSPKAREFPKGLAPDHRSWEEGIFADRFRAQCWDEPATTITSHICKDGHYFIHPDMSQCRTLTVREAARLQTFPDNYLFLGNRTEQYVQVGNAVPPFLARQIAEVLWRCLTAERTLSGLPPQIGTPESVRLYG